MKEQAELMRRISQSLFDALENNTLKTIGRAIEEIANGLVEDANELEEEI